MRILLAHNRYQHKGGEDSVFLAEGDLLRENGHEVLEYTKSNESIKKHGSISVAIDAIWAHQSYKELRATFQKSKPDIVHVHNYVPRISPAIFYAAHAENIPIVQTLHNFRMVCVDGMLMRNGAICEKCVEKKIKWPGVVHGCYRNSRLASATVASMLSIHHALGTWHNKVTRYITLTNFQRNKLITAGYPAERLVVKPNFCPDSSSTTTSNADRSRGLFVGRLSHEKGIDVLVDAARKCSTSIDLIGSGPKLEAVQAAAPDNLHVHGYVNDEDMHRIQESALFLVLPSIVYEGFPMVIPEAFSMGIPIIASRHGGMQEIIEDGVTGLHFTPGDASDLAAKIKWASENPDKMRDFGRNARRIYESKFSPKQNLEILTGVYRDAIEEVAPARAPAIAFDNATTS